MRVKTGDPDHEPADQSRHSFQKWYEVTNTVVTGRNLINAKMTSISIILPTHLHGGINDHFCVLVQSFLNTVYIKISWLLVKPTDQDPHCFPI